MISDDVIAEVRSRTDIVAVIGQTTQLKKAGRSWKGLCPFHGEKTPSFNVMPDKGFFHCFGCQKNGDVIAFVMEIEGKSFREVVEQLAARLGLELPEEQKEDPAKRAERGERLAMLALNKVATEFFRTVLADPKRGEPGRAYLAKRGVGAEITEKFKLGYAPGDWHDLADELKAQGCDLELAVKLGLVARQPRAGGYYDRYRDRLVCPVIVPGGDVTGFSARVIAKAPPAPDGSEPPKYINSPESTVYKKGKLLFGLAQAREAMHAKKRAVIVEGNFDVITLHQAGFSEVVAPLGTALTAEQLGQLKRLTERVVLLYDGDRAGYKATMHALTLCIEAEIEVQVASRPGHARSGGAGPLADGVDPDSLVASGGAAQLREAVDRAQGGIEFFCFEVWGKARTNADARARALDDAARLVAKVASPTKRDLIIGTLASAMGLDVGVVRAAMRNGQAASQGGGGYAPRAGHPNHPNAGPNAPMSSNAAPNSAVEPPVSDREPPTEEVEIITLLADHPALIASPEADKAFWLLTDERLRAMYSAARAGQSFMELAPIHLPRKAAQHVLSGKYAAPSDARRLDPKATLESMTTNYEIRRATLEQVELRKQLDEVKRSGDRDRERDLVSQTTQYAKLVAALTKGDRDAVARVKAEWKSDMASNRKQVD